MKITVEVTIEEAIALLKSLREHPALDCEEVMKYITESIEESFGTTAERSSHYC